MLIKGCDVKGRGPDPAEPATAPAAHRAAMCLHVLSQPQAHWVWGDRAVVRTSVRVHTDEDEGYSELHVTTTDRPGLLTDIVHSLKDVSVNVISAEVRCLQQLLPRFVSTWMLHSSC